MTTKQATNVLSLAVNALPLVLLAAGAFVLVSGTKRGSKRIKRPSQTYQLTSFRLEQRWPGPKESSYVEKSRQHLKRSDLVENKNPTIVFKDEEKTGVDRFMSEKLNEAMNRLARHTRHEWSGVRVRVTEAFDEENEHTADSTHYQGRGADLTTSDRDPAKLGMLAALATISGFDWVYYEDEKHIHVSVNP